MYLENYLFSALIQAFELLKVSCHILSFIKILSCRCAGSLKGFGSWAPFSLRVGSSFSLAHLPQLLKRKIHT